jgi:hypothetical protein
MQDDLEVADDETLYLEKSNEINVVEKSLTDAQRMEIRRRYDLSIAVGVSAHKIKNQIKETHESNSIKNEKLNTYENFIYIFIFIYIALRFSNIAVATDFLKNYEWFILTPLIVYYVLIFYSRREDKHLELLNKKLVDLETQWNSCNPRYSIHEYIDNRIKNNIADNDRGDFTLVAIGLRKSIISRVDFQYNWC